MYSRNRGLLKRVLSTFFIAIGGAVLGGIFSYSDLKKQVDEFRNLSEKHLSMMLFMNDWVKFKQSGKSMVTYFVEKKYNSIAIYGMSYIGETLVNELEGSSIEILYGIDRRATMISADFEMITPDERLAPVDAIIVTALNGFSEIKQSINKKLACPIVSIEDILYGE